MNKEEYIKALEYIRDSKCQNLNDVRTQFQNVADEVISKLREEGFVVLLTDETIWRVNKERINAHISECRSSMGILEHLKRNKMFYLELVGILVTILGIVISCGSCG